VYRDVYRASNNLFDPIEGFCETAVEPAVVFGLPVILEELKKSLLPGVFSTNRRLSISSRRKLHRAQPLVQQLVFFEKRVTQSFAFR